MSGLDFPELAICLPRHYDFLEHLIVGALTIDCTSQFGRGPVLRADLPTSSTCRICFELLAGELTLTHNKHGPGVDTQPCMRTYHLECMVQWARSNIEQQQPVTCPGDRQILLDQNGVDFFRQTSGLEAQLPHKPHHRSIDTVVPFWQMTKPNNPWAPSATFAIKFMSPQQVLSMASAGFDIGFIDYGVLETLPLDTETKARLRRYGSVALSHDTSSNNGAPAAGSQQGPDKLYEVWLYVQTDRRLQDHATGAEHADYTFMPLSPFARQILRRELWSHLGGCGYHIKYSSNGPLPTKNYLDPADKYFLERESRARIKRSVVQHPDQRDRPVASELPNPVFHPRLIPKTGTKTNLSSTQLSKGSAVDEDDAVQSNISEERDEDDEIVWDRHSEDSDYEPMKVDMRDTSFLNRKP